MRYTINLPDEAAAKLQERAQANSTSTDVYIEQIVQDALTKPTLREILAPIHQEFLESGMSEGELDSVLQDALQQSRHERHVRKGA
jgi:predicted transcriptional regulator